MQTATTFWAQRGKIGFNLSTTVDYHSFLSLPQFCRKELCFISDLKEIGRKPEIKEENERGGKGTNIAEEESKARINKVYM
jgi:hypothetical protein